MKRIGLLISVLLLGACSAAQHGAFQHAGADTFGEGAASATCTPQPQVYRPPVRAGGAGSVVTLGKPCDAVKSSREWFAVASKSAAEAVLTASGPDGVCFVGSNHRAPRTSETVSGYYDEVILPLQAVMYYKTAGRDYDEIDVDCISQAFPRRELSKMARISDPIALYADTLLWSQSSCVGFKSRIENLEKIFDIPASPQWNKALVRRQRRVIEAPFVAGHIVFKCGGRVGDSVKYYGLASRLGYEPALYWLNRRVQDIRSGRGIEFR